MSRTSAPASKNTFLDRRTLLRRGLAVTAFVPVAASAAAPWRFTPGAGFSNYGQPASHEDSVIRWISATEGAPGNGISWCPLHELDGTITPNGLHFERHHNGVPAIDPAVHELVIHGLVERPLRFSVAALLRYPRESRICVIECGGNSNAGWRRQPIQSPAGYFHGLVSCSEWTGVPVAHLLAEAGVSPDARWAIAEGADAFGMTVSVPLAKLREDALLALYQNGERLRPEQGYPVRLLLPGFEGVLNVKWLRTLKITDRPVMARNETARYTELQASGKARQFTFTMGVKSLLTAPSAGMRLPQPGIYELSGLAWSGAGRIARVEVSADGGASWTEAVLNEPVLPRSFTRFRLPWQWGGHPAVLQSRATDDAGRVQPTRAALVAAHGRHGYFHYNAIVSWEILRDGRVRHVYVDDDAQASNPLDAEWDF